jgi:hypothetical protein
MMEVPEELGDHTYILFMSWRDSQLREYKNTCEVRFTGTKLVDLLSYVETHSQPGRTFKVVKHVPHEFCWKVLDPDMIVTQKKKNKEESFKLSELKDMKMYPISLKDGDHIAICYDDEGVEDDY